MSFKVNETSEVWRKDKFQAMVSLPDRKKVKNEAFSYPSGNTYRFDSQGVQRSNKIKMSKAERKAHKKQRTHQLRAIGVI